MSNNGADYYDEYWKQGLAVSDVDPTTPKRMTSLRAVVRGLTLRMGGLRALDAGCGTGEFAAALSAEGCSVVGADVSEVALDAARIVCPLGRFVKIDDGGHVPIEDGSIDLVWSSEVIEHVFDVHGFLSELNRVLAMGGKLVLTTPFHGRIKVVVIALVKFDSHSDPEISHIRFFDKAGLNRVLSRAGFRVESWGGVGRVWPLYRSWFVVAVKEAEPSAPPVIRG